MSHSYLVVDDDIIESIAAAVTEARKRPIPWEVLQPSAVADPGPYLKFSDRKPGKRPESKSVQLPDGHRVAISFEHQPAGLCIHISVSAPDATKDIPGELVMAMIAGACGIEWPPGPHSRMWIEDFIDGPMTGRAVNLVELVHGVEQGAAYPQ